MVVNVILTSTLKYQNQGRKEKERMMGRDEREGNNVLARRGGWGERKEKEEEIDREERIRGTVNKKEWQPNYIHNSIIHSSPVTYISRKTNQECPMDIGISNNVMNTHTRKFYS